MNRFYKSDTARAKEHSMERTFNILGLTFRTLGCTEFAQSGIKIAKVNNDYFHDLS